MVITRKKVLLPIGTCTITNGPAKYDFQASLFDKKTVQFSINTSTLISTMDIGEKFNVDICLAGKEDGSAESWIGTMLISSLDGKVSEERTFYYDTRRRKGTIMEAGRVWKLSEKE